MLHVVVSRFQHDAPGLKVILYQACDISRVRRERDLNGQRARRCARLWQQRHGRRENLRI